MIVVVGLVAFVLGVIFTHIAHKETIKDLERKLSETRAKSVEKLTDAYDRIDKLETINKSLIKQLSNDTRN